MRKVFICRNCGASYSVEGEFVPSDAYSWECDECESDDPMIWAGYQDEV